MRKALFATKTIMFGLFLVTLLATLLQLMGNRNPLRAFNPAEKTYNQIEDYDPALSRLNTVDKLENYCDSIYKCCSKNVTGFAMDYTEVVSAIVRKRFYHGYSYYGFQDNYLLAAFSKITQDGYSATVIPDDILKSPHAACSQQSIVMMELLRRKNISTRKVSFQGKFSGGHFCFEVFYQGNWHFYDPNLEPDAKLLKSYGRPDIAYLVSHQDLLLDAYRLHPKEMVLDVFPTFQIGAVNEFPAPRGIIFQKLAKFLSYTLWAFFMFAYLIVRYRYNRATKNYVRNRRIYFPQPQRGTSSYYYPGITASGS